MRSSTPTAERQLALIRSYPQLGSVFSDLTPANALSVADQAMAGLDRLDSEEHQTLRQPHPGLPGEVRLPDGDGGAREHQGDDPAGWQRPAAEQPRPPSSATALVEIAKIANLRLLDRVEEPDYAATGSA